MDQLSTYERIIRRSSTDILPGSYPEIYNRVLLSDLYPILSICSSICAAAIIGSSLFAAFFTATVTLRSFLFSSHLFKCYRRPSFSFISLATRVGLYPALPRSKNTISPLSHRYWWPNWYSRSKGRSAFETVFLLSISCCLIAILSTIL